MMQLFIKENLKNDQRMTVRDNRGQIIYLIQGRWGRQNDLMSLYKINGKHLLTLKQLNLSPIPVFDLFENGEKAGTMRKHPGLFGIRDSYFTLTPHDWVITGDFEDLYFTVHQKKKLIMECEKDLKSGSTIYELNIKNDEDAPLMALITTLFDHYSRKKEDEVVSRRSSDADYGLGFFSSFKSTSVAILLPMQNMKQKTK